MFMRITWGRVDSGKWADFETRYRQVAKADVPGLLARWLINDTKDPDSIFAVTLWSNADAIRAWENSPDYKNNFLAALEPYMVGAYSVSVCEVKFDDISGLKKALGR